MSAFPRAPRRFAHHPLFERGVQLGYAARGLLYTVVAITAFSVAIGNGGQTTDSSGALQALAKESYGTALLAAVSIGLGAYAIWRILQAFADGAEGDSRIKTAWMRLYYGGRGVLYGVLCWSALRLLLSSGGGSGNGRRSMTQRALELPAGRYIVAAVGLAILGYALWQGYRAVTRRFHDELEMWRMGDGVETVVNTAGVAGYLARMVAFGLIGYFFVQAGLTYDADKAIGLDGALSSLSGTTYGTWLLGAVAIGLLGFAVFSFAEARYRKIEVEH